MNPLCKSIISEFTSGSDDTYRYLYLYGSDTERDRAAELLIAGYSAQFPDASVVSLTGASFVDACIDSYFQDTVFSWVSAMSSCGLLLINGINEIAGREASMQHAYYILDKRLEAHAPFVILGSYPLCYKAGLAPRIMTILEGSLVCAIS